MGVHLRVGDRVREPQFDAARNCYCPSYSTGVVVEGVTPGTVAIAWDALGPLHERTSLPFRSGEQRDSIEVVPPDPRHGRRT